MLHSFSFISLTCHNKSQAVEHESVSGVSVPFLSEEPDDKRSITEADDG